MKHFFLTILLVCMSFMTYAFDHSHKSFDVVLERYVINGLVNYKGLYADQTGLNDYLKNLSAVTESDYNTFSDNEKIAFLINAYNGFTLRLILDNYPGLKSIGDIGGPVRALNIASGAPWKIAFFELLDKKRTLNWIEHEKLRVDFKEPRIHFAINCASIGCPVLAKTSFKAESLDEQLENAFLYFMRDSSKNYYDESSGTLYVSKIFDWFAKDFTIVSGTIQNYVSRGFDVSTIENARVRFTKYDWLLNEAFE